jgi:hypothetical protein
MNLEIEEIRKKKMTTTLVCGNIVIYIPVMYTIGRDYTE